MERKKEADRLYSEDKKIELLLQEAFDYSDEQLLKELEMAEAQVESAQMAEEEKSLDGEKNLVVQCENTAPSDEFQQIMEKMRERGIEPKLETELKGAVSHPVVELDTNLRAAETSEPERPPEGETETDTDTEMDSAPRPRRFGRRAWGIILAAALAGTLLWATGLGVSGRKVLEYEANVRDSDKSNIAWNNESENYVEVDNEEEAYKIIGEKLGIPVLKLGYRPEGMKFKKLVLKTNTAVLEFTYKEKSIHFIQSRNFNENSDTASSDRVAYRIVENSWIGRELSIEENRQDNGNKEYSMTFEIDKNYYYLEGPMEENEFISMVENLNF